MNSESSGLGAVCSYAADDVEESRVKSVLPGDLGMERGAEQDSLLDRDDASVLEGRKRLRGGAHLGHERGADEDRMHVGLPQHGDRQLGLE